MFRFVCSLFFSSLSLWSCSSLLLAFSFLFLFLLHLPLHHFSSTANHSNQVLSNRFTAKNEVLHLFLRPHSCQEEHLSLLIWRPAGGFIFPSFGVVFSSHCSLGWRRRRRRSVGSHIRIPRQRGLRWRWANASSGKPTMFSHGRRKRRLHRGRRLHPRPCRRRCRWREGGTRTR